MIEKGRTVIIDLDTEVFYAAFAGDAKPLLTGYSYIKKKQSQEKIEHQFKSGKFEDDNVPKTKSRIITDKVVNGLPVGKFPSNPYFASKHSDQYELFLPQFFHQGNLNGGRKDGENRIIDELIPENEFRSIQQGVNYGINIRDRLDALKITGDSIYVERCLTCDHSCSLHKLHPDGYPTILDALILESTKYRQYDDIWNSTIDILIIGPSTLVNAPSETKDEYVNGVLSSLFGWGLDVEQVVDQSALKNDEIKRESIRELRIRKICIVPRAAVLIISAGYISGTVIEVQDNCSIVSNVFDLIVIDAIASAPGGDCLVEIVQSLGLFRADIDKSLEDSKTRNDSGLPIEDRDTENTIGEGDDFEGAKAINSFLSDSYPYSNEPSSSYLENETSVLISEVVDKLYIREFLLENVTSLDVSGTYDKLLPGPTTGNRTRRSTTDTLLSSKISRLVQNIVSLKGEREMNHVDPVSGLSNDSSESCEQVKDHSVKYNDEFTQQSGDSLELRMSILLRILPEVFFVPNAFSPLLPSKYSIFSPVSGHARRGIPINTLAHHPSISRGVSRSVYNQISRGRGMKPRVHNQVFADGVAFPGVIPSRIQPETPINTESRISKETDLQDDIPFRRDSNNLLSQSPNKKCCESLPLKRANIQPNKHPDFPREISAGKYDVAKDSFTKRSDTMRVASILDTSTLYWCGCRFYNYSDRICHTHAGIWSKENLIRTSRLPKRPKIDDRLAVNGTPIIIAGTWSTIHGLRGRIAYASRKLVEEAKLKAEMIAMNNIIGGIPPETNGCDSEHPHSYLSERRGSNVISSIIRGGCHQDSHAQNIFNSAQSGISVSNLSCSDTSIHGSTNSTRLPDHVIFPQAQYSSTDASTFTLQTDGGIEQRSETLNRGIEITDTEIPRIKGNIIRCPHIGNQKVLYPDTISRQEHPFASFHGASVLVNTPSFESLLMTHRDYVEGGPGGLF